MPKMERITTCLLSFKDLNLIHLVSASSCAFQMKIYDRQYLLSKWRQCVFVSRFRNIISVVDSEHKMPMTGSPTFADSIVFSDNALPDHLMPASAGVLGTSMQNGQAKVEVAFIVNGRSIWTERK